MEEAFWIVRRSFKKLKSRFWFINSFCDKCGIDIRDFKVPDVLWNQIIGFGVYTNLCYNCFCDAGDSKGFHFRYMIIKDG